MNLFAATKLGNWGRLGVFALACLSSLAPGFAETDDEREVRIGKEAVVQIEKDLKLLKDEAAQARVDAIAKRLSEIANTVEVKGTWGNPKLAKFDYTFKLVDDKDVNAFSLPGGFIYLNKGLLDFCETDDELAGVMAHEIAHASHRHLSALIKKQSSIQNSVLIPLLVAIIVGQPPAEDAANMLYGSQLYSTARINAYSQDAERDADATGAKYMALAKLNPVGIFTFLDRLRNEEATRPKIDWGIFRTHPPTEERAADLKRFLGELNIPLRPSQTSTSLRVTARPVKDGDAGLYEVVFGSSVIYQPTADPTLGSSKERADAFAAELNLFFDGSPELFAVRNGSGPNQIRLDNRLALEVSDEDAKLAKATPADLTQQTIERIKTAVSAYRLKRAD